LSNIKEAQQEEEIDNFL